MWSKKKQSALPSYCSDFDALSWAVVLLPSSTEKIGLFSQDHNTRMAKFLTKFYTNSLVDALGHCRKIRNSTLTVLDTYTSAYRCCFASSRAVPLNRVTHKGSPRWRILVFYNSTPRPKDIGTGRILSGQTTYTCFILPHNIPASNNKAGSASYTLLMSPLAGPGPNAHIFPPFSFSVLYFTHSTPPTLPLQ